MKRCGVRGWSCGRVCGRVLTCETHTCEARCHVGEQDRSRSQAAYLHMRARSHSQALAVVNTTPFPMIILEWLRPRSGCQLFWII